MGVPRPSASALRPPLCATPWVCGDARGCSGIAVGPSRWLGVAGVCGFNFSADFSLPEPHRAQSPTEAFQNAKHGSQFARSRCRAGISVPRVVGRYHISGAMSRQSLPDGPYTGGHTCRESMSGRRQVNVFGRARPSLRVRAVAGDKESASDALASHCAMIAGPAGWCPPTGVDYVNDDFG